MEWKVWSARSLVGCVLVSAAGCGARTALNLEDYNVPSATGAALPSPAPEAVTPPATQEPGRGSMGGFLAGSQALPPCELGVPINEAAQCDYVYEGRCYDSSLDACACACPANRTDTRCASGFPDENGSIAIKYCE